MIDGTLDTIHAERNGRIDAISNARSRASEVRSIRAIDNIRDRTSPMWMDKSRSEILMEELNWFMKSLHSLSWNCMIFASHCRKFLLSLFFMELLHFLQYCRIVTIEAAFCLLYVTDVAFSSRVTSFFLHVDCNVHITVIRSIWLPACSIRSHERAPKCYVRVSSSWKHSREHIHALPARRNEQHEYKKNKKNLLWNEHRTHIHIKLRAHDQWEDKRIERHIRVQRQFMSKSADLVK